MTRQLTKYLWETSNGIQQPDTGRAVTIKTDDALPVQVASGSEAPPHSGRYIVTWTEQEKYGFWYLDGVKKSVWGKIWLGSVVGSENSSPNFIVTGSLHTGGFQMPSGAVNGYVLTSNGSGIATWQSPSGTGFYPSSSIPHSSLQNLAYTTSGHSGFAGTGVVNQFTAGQQFQAGIQATGSVLINGNALFSSDNPAVDTGIIFDTWNGDIVRQTIGPGKCDNDDWFIGWKDGIQAGSYDRASMTIMAGNTDPGIQFSQILIQGGGGDGQGNQGGHVILRGGYGNNNPLTAGNSPLSGNIYMSGSVVKVASGLFQVRDNSEFQGGVQVTGSSLLKATTVDGTLTVTNPNQILVKGASGDTQILDGRFETDRSDGFYFQYNKTNGNVTLQPQNGVVPRIIFTNVATTYGVNLYREASAKVLRTDGSFTIDGGAILHQTQVTGSLLVNGIANISSNLQAGGYSWFPSGMEIGSVSSFADAFHVTGTTNFAGTVGIAGNTTITGIMQITGSVHANGTVQGWGATPSQIFTSLPVKLKSGYINEESLAVGRSFGGMQGVAQVAQFSNTSQTFAIGSGSVITFGSTINGEGGYEGRVLGAIGGLLEHGIDFDTYAGALALYYVKPSVEGAVGVLTEGARLNQSGSLLIGKTTSVGGGNRLEVSGSVSVTGSVTASDNITASGNLRANGTFISSDGTGGKSGTVSFDDGGFNPNVVTIKNGIITSWLQSSIEQLS